MICTRCGTELVEGALFCHMCGRAADWKPAKKKRGNRQGTALKRGKTWTGYSPGYSYITVDEDGNAVKHRVRPSKGGFRTKAEALAWASQGADSAEKPVPRFIELWEGYEKSDYKRLSDSKRTAYRIAKDKLRNIMGRPIDSVTLDELQAEIDRTCPTYYPARDCKSVLSHLYERAMADNGPKGRITNNLARYIVLPEVNEQEATPFTAEEVKAVWKLYESGDLTAGRILVMLYTGLMPTELLTVTADMVDSKRREIRGAGAKTAARKAAAVAYPEFLAPVLENILSHSKKGKLVETSKWPFYDDFYVALAAAGIDNPVDEKGRHRLTPYSCRHTYGTEAVKAGLHPAVVQQMLRHSNTKTQERYTHLGSEELHTAVDKLPK